MKSTPDWKQIAKQLARAIRRFENNDWAYNLSDNAYDLARKVVSNKRFK